MNCKLGAFGLTNYQTAQRKLLMEFLRSNPDQQFSAKQILGAISDSSISLSAVYRNLGALEAEGLVNRFSKEGSREAFYQYTNGDICRNSIHLNCTKCNKTFHMSTKEMEKMMDGVLESDGFEINKVKTILYGVCKECK